MWIDTEDGDNNKKNGQKQKKKFTSQWNLSMMLTLLSLLFQNEEKNFLFVYNRNTHQSMEFR